MNIVILGTGTVGYSIADLLCQREHSVTVVDIDPQRIKRINDQFDVRAIVGSASQSSVLFQAGINVADICLAVTGCDEVNIVAASMAKSMGARRSIARVYSPVFRDLSTFDYQRHFNIDRMLSLEHLTAMELARNIRDPGSVVVEQFARGGLQVQELIVGQEGKVTRMSIRELRLAPNIRIGTIQRENRMWIAAADDVIQIGDRVTVFSRPEDMKSIKTLFKNVVTHQKSVIIGGGGETGLQLARTLEREGYRVLIVDIDEDRCQFLASHLETTKIINCDVMLRENLEEERVGSADVFVACTGDDEDNLILGVEAVDVGAKQVMAIISRPDYENVVHKLGIDVAVSQRNVMARQILAYLTTGAVVSRTKLPGGLINVIEVEVVENSAATKSNLAEMDLPDRCLVVAVIQQEIVRVPGGNDRLHAGDTVIMLVEEDVVEASLARITVPDPTF